MYSRQVQRVRKLLVISRRIDTYEADLLKQRAIIARFAIVVLLRVDQAYYRRVLSRYMRDTKLMQGKAEEAHTARSIFDILDVSKAF